MAPDRVDVDEEARVDGDRRMHLAWFLGNGFGVHDWKSQWRGNAATNWMTGEFHIEFVRALERACFDYLIIEDSAYVPDGYEASTRYYLKHARAVPKHDPAVLATVMLSATKHIGVVPTLAVTEYQPYLLARLVATLDSLSGGRAGVERRHREFGQGGAELRQAGPTGARPPL